MSDIGNPFRRDRRRPALLCFASFRFAARRFGRLVFRSHVNGAGHSRGAVCDEAIAGGRSGCNAEPDWRGDVHAHARSDA
ncbi:hypothetical protein [Burkholderia thailandensis]|uniref:hypothetical protein n=1 Tax=Burkholderia thailandensis TaxID=57975 RepID=UPI0012B667FD|nr:hypothetical protein [Burkholderia thailandensis]MBS2131200.1 hypothetical protein [Burkholderia thailandensis]MCS6469747.1 hypothetical protein [Burkholderia thailandensis]NBC92174.1 hypothetical protein [Burkholderia thailandensis]NOK47098.1 hypothetical protein [Burkholderia thailandensis]QRA13875.1 hypothetical protein JMY07_17430 [Burkholderia thailandensis]